MAVAKSAHDVSELDTSMAHGSTENGATMAKDGAKSSAPLPRQDFLQLFWQLAENDVATRTQAAARLLAHLRSESHAGESDKFHEDLHYTLKRLVRGLASSRDAARQGFSAALAAVLGAFARDGVNSEADEEGASRAISLKQTMALLKDAMAVRPSMKGMEQREHMFGLLFGLLAIHRSGKLAQADKAVTVAVVHELLTIGAWKKWLREAAFEAVLAVLSELPRERFAAVEALLAQALTGDVSSFNADQVALAAGVHHYLHVQDLTGSVDAAFPARDFVRRNRMAQLVEPLKLSSNVYPRVHGAWFGIFGHIVHAGKHADCFDSELLQEAWQVLVENMLVAPTTTTHERKGLALKLFELLVPQLPAPLLRSILTPHFVRALYNNSVSKKTILHDAARHALQVFAQQAPEEFVHFMAMQFVQPSSSLVEYALEEDDQEDVADDADALAAKKQVQEEHEARIKKGGFDAIIAIEEAKERAELVLKKTDNVRMWALDLLMGKLVDLTAQAHEEQTAARDQAARLRDQLVRLLLFHAFFKQSSTTSTPTSTPKKQHKKKHKKHSSSAVAELDAALLSPEPALSTNMRSACAKRLFNSLSVKLSSGPESMLSRCFSIAEELMGQGPGALELRHAMDEAATQVFDQSTRRVHTLREKRRALSSDAEAASKQLDAFLMLFMSAAVQLLDVAHREDATGVLVDLDKCYVAMMERPMAQTTPKQKKKKAKGKSKAREEEEPASNEPDSLVVLTDMLLSLVSQDSSAMREIVTQVFRSMLSVLNAACLETMLNVLVPAPEDEGEDGDAKGDDDEDEEMEDEEEDDDEEEEIVLSSAADVAEALSNDAQLAELHREDQALASIVRQVKDKSQRRKQAKRERTRVIHFKLRVLDLLQIYSTKCSSQIHVLQLVLPLFQSLLAVTSSENESRVLVERLHGVLNKLFKAKDVPVLSDARATAQAMDVLNELIELLRSKALEKEQAKVGANAVVFLIRVLCGRASGASSQTSCTREVAQALRPAVLDCFVKKHAKFPRAALEELVTRFPRIAVELLLKVLSDLAAASALESSENAPVDDFTKSEVFRLLAALLKPKLIAEAPALFEQVQSTLQKALMEAIKGHAQLKAKRVKCILSCALHFAKVVVDKEPKASKKTLAPFMQLLSTLDSSSPVVKGMVKQILEAAGHQKQLDAATPKPNAEPKKKRKRSKSTGSEHDSNA